jgi:hypothetical protein
MDETMITFRVCVHGRFINTVYAVVAFITSGKDSHLEALCRSLICEFFNCRWGDAFCWVRFFWVIAIRFF